MNTGYIENWSQLLKMFHEKVEFSKKKKEKNHSPSVFYKVHYNIESITTS